MARGLSNAEIGKRLYLSAATVTTHVTAILAKLGVRDRLQAVSAAYQSGAVGPHAATEPSNSTSVIDSKPGQWPYPVRDGGSVARCGRCAMAAVMARRRWRTRGRGRRRVRPPWRSRSSWPLRASKTDPTGCRRGLRNPAPSTSSVNTLVSAARCGSARRAPGSGVAAACCTQVGRAGTGTGDPGGAGPARAASAPRRPGPNAGLPDRGHSPQARTGPYRGLDPPRSGPGRPAVRRHLGGPSYPRAMPSPPLRKLVDWSDEAGPLKAWLARWAAAGWLPEHGQGAQTDITGRRG